MKVKTPAVGGICQSLQGRDKGRHYIISSVNADGTINVVDGNFKKFANPKKKNLKHVYLLPVSAENIAEKLNTGVLVYDTEVYSALKTYNALQQPDGQNKNN